MLGLENVVQNLKNNIPKRTSGGKTGRGGGISNLSFSIALNEDKGGGEGGGHEVSFSRKFEKVNI